MPSKNTQPGTHPTAQQMQVPAGQPLLLWLAEGSELRNLAAPVIVHPRDALGSPPMHLGTGQGWRAPFDGWINLQATVGCSTVQLDPPSASPWQARENRPGLKDWMRWWGWR